MNPPVPANEATRLEILKGYEILETGPDAHLDDIASLAKEICGTPIALISLVDEGRQWIHLPALIERIRAEVDRRSSLLPQGEGETVLVVDDEEAIRNITRRTLETFGYQVLLAADGAEAVSVYVLHQSAIQVVITDMMMPLMDGPSTIHVLRHLNPSLRIIGTSGINTGHNIAKAAAAGVNHFLAKPYTVETLLQTIRMVLEKQGRA